MNTLMLQKVLKEPAWSRHMTEEDWRGLTPLIYLHVNPYGRVELDLEQRIDFDRRLAALRTKHQQTSQAAGRRAAPIGHGSLKTSHNKGYGKYAKRYQYVMPFFAKSHGRSLADPEPCETLLRNRQVMQQGYAC